MAKEQGGRRVPNKPASYSGVGKSSRRTDGQPIRTPNVQDSTDLTQGDRAKLEAGQRIQPLGRTPQPSVGGGRPVPPMQQGGALPEHLFSLPSTRPSEPESAGLPFGPGPGPEVLRPQPQDEREAVLDWLASQPNAPQAIVNMQAEIRASRMAPPPRPMPMPEAPVEEPVVAEAEPSPITPVEDDVV